MVTTADVPGRFDVGIGGVGFMLMEEGDQPALEWQSIRQQREQAGGASVNIGEASVNPEGFWRRSVDGWHKGAGQRYLDRDESDRLRFHASRRVDVFGTKQQVSLVHALDEAHVMSGTILSVAPTVVGARLYFLDDTNTNLKFVESPTTLPWAPTTVTGLPGSALSVAVIGSSVFVGTTSGIYVTDATSSAATGYVTGAPLEVWAAKGRLMVAGASGTLYNVTASGALPSPLITFPTGYGVVGVCGESNWIYIAVQGSSAPSLIYKTTIEPDGTALAVPTVAGEFPEGETLVAVSPSPVFAANGYLFVHTNRGVRMASLDDNGNLTFGDVIESSFTNTAAFATQGRFVWFQLADAFGVRTVGKLDLTAFTDANTPAYASDMEPPDGAAVIGMTSYGGQLIVATTAHIYVENPDAYVDDGYVDSGLIALDLADPKTPVSMDVEAAYPSDASVTEALSVDRGGSFTGVHTWEAGDTGEAAIVGVAASRNFELRATLTASADNTETPVLYRHTLKTEPNISQGDYVILRLRLFESQVDNTGSATGRTPNTDIALLQGWQATREVVDLQLGSLTYTATLRDLDLTAETRCASTDDGSWNTTATARFKILAAA